ncbi:MAG: extracellular solute-binding protein [Clostridiales bacterium]|jgi:ABC-type glycerol-3-phosphate transport system substrate-binding protein|nr:extracellular solute-binding protein [Clostridiales bacterium]
MKKFIAIALSLLFTASLAACSGSESPPTDAPASNAAASSAPAPSAEKTDEPVEAPELPAEAPSFDQINIGDYAGITANLQFKTHRTDIVDTIFQGYIADFQKIYPNISINYEAITDYAETMTTRVSTPDWGDICMIVTTIPNTELINYFQPLGSTSVLAETYNFADNKANAGVTYGISSTNNVQGVLYNKAVFEQAGITAVPKTPAEFIDALKKVKENTDAIPLYTNFSAGWTMGAWDAYIGGSATGDPDFMNIKLPHAKDPFKDRGDGTGPYAVYSVLYDAVSQGLVEDDPSTTDWEGSKGMFNRGEIATMVLGSWAIVQMQEAGPNSADVGYMSFPISVNGKQYASAGPDYNYGINLNSSVENKIASLLYIKYLVENSNFDYDQGGVPTVKTHELPSTLAAFDGIELVADNPAKESEEDLFTNINVDSEVSLNMDNQHVIDIVEAALGGGKTLAQLTDEWNARWTASQEKYGVTPE